VRWPRLVATDLDGTLVRSDFTVSARSAATLARISAAGAVVVLVTGRPIRWLSNVYAHLPARPLAVCGNGAAVYDPSADLIMHENVLSPPVLAAATAALQEAAPGVIFAVERDGGRQMWHEPAFPVGPWELGPPYVRPAPLAELVGAPAAKLLARRAEDGLAPVGMARADGYATLVRSALDGIAEATHSSSSGTVEISATGVTKASGLAWVAGRLGVPARDVLAFGDMPNDLPMLAWAGRSVAVANAHPSVRAAADDTTADHDDDGVARYLERLLDRADEGLSNLLHDHE
jgi:hydroxymethylpyrimidine pyrophosphatase-like HAD family hydrolase